MPKIKYSSHEQKVEWLIDHPQLWAGYKQRVMDDRKHYVKNQDIIARITNWFIELGMIGRHTALRQARWSTQQALEKAEDTIFMARHKRLFRKK